MAFTCRSDFRYPLSVALVTRTAIFRGFSLICYDMGWVTGCVSAYLTLSACNAERIRETRHHLLQRSGEVSDWDQRRAYESRHGRRQQRDHAIVPVIG